MALLVNQMLKLLELAIAGAAAWFLLSYLQDHLGRPVAWFTGLLILVLVVVGLYRRFRKL